MALPYASSRFVIASDPGTAFEAVQAPGVKAILAQNITYSFSFMDAAKGVFILCL